MDILGALGQLYMKVLLLLLFAGSGLAVWALIKSFQSKGNNKVQSKATTKNSESNRNNLTNIKFEKKLGGIIMNGNGWFKLAIFSLAGIVISAVLLGFISTNSGTGMNMNGMNMNSNQQANMNMGTSSMGNNSMQNGMNGNNMNSGNSNMQAGMTNNNMNNNNMQSGMSMNGQAPMNSTNSSASIQEQLNSIQNQLNQLQTQMQQQSQMNNTQNQNSNMSNGSSGSSSGSMSSGGGMSMM